MSNSTVVSKLHDDDTFHPSGDNPMAFESFWFSFYVPERKLMVYVYPWFRPNLGIAGGGVLAWDDRGSNPWDMTHADYVWSKPFAGPASLINGGTLTLPQGVTIDCLEPLTKYRIRYQHAAMSLDVTFTATQPANVARKSLGGTQLFAGHIDQPGHLVGWVEVRGERLPVDCFSMRDRSWGVRTDDNTTMHLGYFHATISASEAFLAVLDSANSDNHATLINGYLIRDNVYADLKTGRSVLTRAADGSPLTCLLTVVDEKGRELEAKGTAISRFAYQVQPGMFNWSALTEWTFGNQRCLGELQDTWYPDRYREFAQRLLQGPLGKVA